MDPDFDPGFFLEARNGIGSASPENAHNRVAKTYRVRKPWINPAPARYVSEYCKSWFRSRFGPECLKFPNSGKIRSGSANHGSKYILGVRRILRMALVPRGWGKVIVLAQTPAKSKIATEGVCCRSSSLPAANTHLIPMLSLDVSPIDSVRALDKAT